MGFFYGSGIRDNAVSLLTEMHADVFNIILNRIIYFHTPKRIEGQKAGMPHEKCGGCYEYYPCTTMRAFMFDLKDGATYDVSDYLATESRAKAVDAREWLTGNCQDFIEAFYTSTPPSNETIPVDEDINILLYSRGIALSDPGAMRHPNETEYLRL